MKGVSLQLGPYRFAPALWPTLTFGVVFPILLGLGYWQMHRAGEKQLLVERHATGEVMAPLTLIAGS